MHFSPQANDAMRARAQPWLGTLVEVALPFGEASEPAFAAAFDEIATVQRLMSAHDPHSDVRQITRFAHRRAVQVDARTYEVLTLADELAKLSGDRFAVTVAPALARLGLLPAGAAPHVDSGPLRYRLVLEGAGRVRATGPVAIDLGGIAKGYAVDRAVAALRARGVTRGIVNAGGDLCAWTDDPDDWTPIRVRRPDAPTRTIVLCTLHNVAAATSASYFQPYGQPAIVNPRSGRSAQLPGSITVIAPTCALADALTKLVALAPRESPRWLQHYSASALRLNVRAGQLQCDTTMLARSPFVRTVDAIAA
jgi:thiamine biosynthesis lipoprotein